MTEPTELLPCPFCGGDARTDAHADDCYFMLHRKLNALPESDLSMHLEVLAAWNRRTPQPTQAQAGAVVVTTDTTGRCVAVTRQDEEGRVLSVIWQAPEAQAGVVPLTPIRQAALDLYKPPFRHEHGYIRDANNQIVSDDASSVATGLIAARIRGWGRIQYMDKPEMRANALQDEVAEMVAEALNAYWAANGIKGGQ